MNTRIKEFNELCDKWDEVYENLLKDSQRAQGIIGLCLLDNPLEDLLRATMIDDDAVDELIDSDGYHPLSSFSSKLKLAYALGLIPETVKRDLEYINKIRNKFAHKEKVTTFAENPICDWCGGLSTAKTKAGDRVEPNKAYWNAIAKNSIFLWNEILIRQKQKADGQKQELEACQRRYDTSRTPEEATDSLDKAASQQTSSLLIKKTSTEEEIR